MRNVLFAITALAIGALLLSACGADISVEDAQAQRIRAEGELKLDEAEAYAQRVAANTQASNESHSRVMDAMPYVILIACLAGLAACGMIVLPYCLIGIRPAPQTSPPSAPALPAPTINIFLLPPPDSGRRADYWRQIEAATNSQMTICRKEE